MASIKSKNTKFEISFLRILSATLYPKGYRYRKHYRKLPGIPDIVFVKHKVVVFLDSNFWHGRDFKQLKGKLSEEYWLPKIKRNMERDKEVNKKLQKLGWRVIRFWEHEIKKDPHKVVAKIEKMLDNKT